MADSLIDVLRKHNVPVRQHGEDHHVTNGWVGVPCPFCGNQSQFHFGFHLGSGAASCWICGPHNRITAVAKLCGIDYGEAARLLGDTGEQARRTPDRPQGTFRPPAGIGPLQGVHCRYLAARGLQSNIIAKLWNVGGIGVSPGLSWRIYIPIRNAAGRTVSWTTRSLADDGRRYISAPASSEAEPAGQLLYGAELARLAVIVVEGPVDAWAVGPGAVATLGVSYSREQVAAISQFPSRAVCFDSSPDAQARAEELCGRLAGFPGRTTNVQLETGDDPADCSPDELAALRAEFLDV